MYTFFVFLLLVGVLVGQGVSAKTSEECQTEFKGTMSQIDASCDKDKTCENEYSSNALQNLNTCLATVSNPGGNTSGGSGGGNTSAAGKYGLDATAKEASLPNVGVDLTDMVGKVLAAVLSLTATIFLVLMIYAGFTWMTAQGNTEKVNTAKKIIINSVLGLVVIAMAYAITKFVFGALGA